MPLSQIDANVPSDLTKPLGTVFLVFEPEIEVITHQKEHGGIISNRLQPIDKEQFPLFVVLERQGPKVQVRYKIDFFSDNHRQLL